MDTRWLQDFVTLAELQNFTKAAEVRNVSQAAFSRRMQALEQWIGAKLIDRSSYPTQLTRAGEHFRLVASALLTQIADARADIAEAPSRNHVRIALNYALASTWLPQWWSEWAGHGAFTCSLEVGNVHDTVSALNAGSVDILITFHQATHPIQLDSSYFDRYQVGVETVRPYLSNERLNVEEFQLPGREAGRVPLLMYSPSSYFARVVDSAIGQSNHPISGYCAFETEVTDILADLASKGLGIAWLPDSTFGSGRFQNLVPIGDGVWDIEVDIVALRAKANQRNVVLELWEKLGATF